MQPDSTALTTLMSIGNIAQDGRKFPPGTDADLCAITQLPLPLDATLKGINEAVQAALQQAPPPTNRGVQTAKMPTMQGRLSVDWLQCTLPEGANVEELKRMLGADGWQTLPRGMMGYKSQQIRGNVRLLYDGQKGMGVHLIASGQGCRELEAQTEVESLQSLFARLLQAGGSFTRCDVAIDDTAGRVTFQNIDDCIARRTVVSRYRHADPRGLIPLSPNNTEQPGRTINFGSVKSETRIRIYDKAAEQHVSGQWMRVELQARNERAQAIALLVASDNIGTIPGVIRGLLDFKQEGTHSQRERWKSAEWWADFLEWAEKLRLSVEPAIRTLDTLRAWVRRQVAPALALLLVAGEGDYAEIFELVEEGRHRLKPRHLSMLVTGEA